jgi:hypothetical protein
VEATHIAEYMIVDVLRQADKELLYNDQLAASAKHRKTLCDEVTAAENEHLARERKEAIWRKLIVSIILEKNFSAIK